MTENNRRRFPRVFLSNAIEGFSKIGGAAVKWPNKEDTGLFDISYTGAAMAVPSSQPKGLQKGERLSLSYDFGTGKTVPIDGDLVRKDDKMVAVHFSNLTPQAHLALEKFLHEKMIGLNTKLIDSRYYSVTQDFSHWFHGPADTNFYVWTASWGVDQFVIELMGQVLEWRGGEFLQGESRSNLEDPLEDYTQYVIHDSHKEPLADSAIAAKAVAVLSQVKDEPKIVEGMTKILMDCQ